MAVKKPLIDSNYNFEGCSYGNYKSTAFYLEVGPLATSAGIIVKLESEEAQHTDNWACAGEAIKAASKPRTRTVLFFLL
jgi:hypothetical protein